MRRVNGDRVLGAMESAPAAAAVAQREVDGFDFTDPDCPVVTRACRRCQAELVFEFPGGIRPLLLRYVRQAVCAACGDREEKEIAERAAGDAYKARLHASGISPGLAADVSWESIIVDAASPDDRVKREQALERAKAWGADTDAGARGLWLHGPAGAGKTRLIATAAVERMRHTAVRWVSVAVLVTQLDGAWNDDERKAALKVLTEPGCVVLDDLDKVAPSERVRHALFTALERREQARVSLSVTSNAPPSKISEIYSTPFMSRLIGMTSPLLYPGADRRLELGAEPEA